VDACIHVQMSKQSDSARSRGRPEKDAAGPVEATASAAPKQLHGGCDATAKQSKQQKQQPLPQQQQKQNFFDSLPLLPVEDCGIVQPPASRRCFNRCQGVEEEEEACDSDATEEAEVIECCCQEQELPHPESGAATEQGSQPPEKEAILSKDAAVPPEAEQKPKAKARGKAKAKAKPKAKTKAKAKEEDKAEKDIKSGILLGAEGKSDGLGVMRNKSHPQVRRQSAMEEMSLSDILGNNKPEFRRSSSLDALVGTRDNTDDMLFNGEVKLHVYHLTKQVASIGLPIYHTAIEVYDQEIFFCLDGIVRCSPGGYSQGVEKVVLTLGKTKLNSVRVEQAVKKLKLSWPGKDYKLLSHNCQTFAFEFTQLLLPGYASFPSEYCRFAGPVSKPSGKPNSSLFAGIGA